MLTCLSRGFKSCLLVPKDPLTWGQLTPPRESRVNHVIVTCVFGSLGRGTNASFEQQTFRLPIVCGGRVTRGGGKDPGNAADKMESAGLGRESRWRREWSERRSNVYSR
eukprot:761508-Hanusia_phi.AAC.9